MRGYFFLAAILLLFGCKRSSENKSLSAQQIVDKSIEASGGERYTNHDVSYNFRDKSYQSQNLKGKKVLKRIMVTDSLTITDIKKGDGFQRFFNDSLLVLPDTLAIKYANSVNSVHYFSRLPFGLNDSAVKKELLGKVSLKGNDFLKVKVTFGQENGGDDFEDTYLYWFHAQSFKPWYLAYEFHTDGGGMRFREAHNERYVNGIRFVDYRNFKPKKGTKIDLYSIDSLYEANQLELLSNIELKDIKVTPSN